MQLRMLLGLACVLGGFGCGYLPGAFGRPGYGIPFMSSPQPQQSYLPTPDRPPGAYDPYPVQPPFGVPQARLLPPTPPPRPEYVPLTSPTDESVWLAGHWFWEDGWAWDGARWRQPAGWVWAEGRWIEPPCPQLDLVQAAQSPLGGGVRWVEAHWRCRPVEVACVCPIPKREKPKQILVSQR